MATFHTITHHIDIKNKMNAKPQVTPIDRPKLTLPNGADKLLLHSCCAREAYEKPTTERKRKKAAAVKRLQKRLRSQTLPPKMY